MGWQKARRCWVYIDGSEDYEEEVVVVDAGEFYAVGTVLDDWYVATPDTVKQLLAKLLKVKKEDLSLKC
jgi:predicted phosphoribosyltransferase